jgi:hypothetical protein
VVKAHSILSISGNDIFERTFAPDIPISRTVFFDWLLKTGHLNCFTKMSPKNLKMEGRFAHRCG